MWRVIRSFVSDDPLRLSHPLCPAALSRNLGEERRGAWGGIIRLLRRRAAAAVRDALEGDAALSRCSGASVATIGPPDERVEQGQCGDAGEEASEPSARRSSAAHIALPRPGKAERMLSTAQSDHRVAQHVSCRTSGPSLG